MILVLSLKQNLMGRQVNCFCYSSFIWGEILGGVGVPSSSRKPGPLPDSSREILKLHMNFEVEKFLKEIWRDLNTQNGMGHFRKYPHTPMEDIGNPVRNAQ